MDKPLRNFMKMGTIAFMSYPSIMGGEGDILGSLEKIARDDFFEAIEITWIKDPAVRAKAAKLLKESGLTVAYGAQPRLLTTGYNINHLDKTERQKALDTLKAGIDEACEMGAVGFGFLSGKYEEATKSDSFEALVESTSELCRYAKSKGDMRVALEVFDFDVDKKSIIGPAALAAKFAERMRKQFDNFGLMVDLSHIPLLHETIEESILPVKDYIVHAHIGNAVTIPGCDAYGDAHPRFGFPNSANGVGELAAYFRLLIKIGYLNEKNPPILSFEVKPFGDEDPELVIANTKRVINRAWAMV